MDLVSFFLIVWFKEQEKKINNRKRISHRSSLSGELVAQAFMNTVSFREDIFGCLTMDFCRAGPYLTPLIRKILVKLSAVPLFTCFASDTSFPFWVQLFSIRDHFMSNIICLETILQIVNWLWTQLFTYSCSCNWVSHFFKFQECLCHCAWKLHESDLTV